MGTRKPLLHLPYKTLVDGFASQRSAPHVAPLMSTVINTIILNKPRNNAQSLQKQDLKVLNT